MVGYLCCCARLLLLGFEVLGFGFTFRLGIGFVVCSFVLGLVGGLLVYVGFGCCCSWWFGVCLVVCCIIWCLIVWWFTMVLYLFAGVLFWFCFVVLD